MPELIVPKEWFEIWRSPREFFRKTDECMGQFEPDEILSMTGVQHPFDAYVAGLFARIRETSHGTENTATYKRDYDLFHIPPLILELRYQIACFRKPIDQYIEEPLIEAQLQIA